MLPEDHPPLLSFITFSLPLPPQWMAVDHHILLEVGLTTESLHTKWRVVDIVGKGVDVAIALTQLEETEDDPLPPRCRLPRTIHPLMQCDTIISNVSYTNFLEVVM